MAYAFQDQLNHGQRYELALDRYFGQFYDIEPASMNLQRMGVDRIFKTPGTTVQEFWEYKADMSAHRTGNSFIETVSVDKGGSVVSHGWAIKTIAHRLVYYITEARLAYVLDPVQVRAKLPVWEARYKSMHCQNKGYRSHGILVPLHNFRGIAQQIIQIP